MLMVGVLKRKMEYGVFVNMLNNLTGLAPNKVLLGSTAVWSCLCQMVGSCVNSWLPCNTASEY